MLDGRLAATIWRHYRIAHRTKASADLAAAVAEARVEEQSDRAREAFGRLADLRCAPARFAGEMFDTFERSRVR